MNGIGCPLGLIKYLEIRTKDRNERKDISDCVIFLGVTYRGSHFIQPELSQSQLSFSDLFLDPDTGRVRQRLSLCACVWHCRASGHEPIHSCLIGSCSGGQNMCLFHFVGLQDDSYPWGWSSGPQQTRSSLCLWWNSGISVISSFVCFFLYDFTPLPHQGFSC